MKRIYNLCCLGLFCLSMMPGLLPAQVGDDFPRIFQFHFDWAPAEWYAQFDIVHGRTNEYVELKQLNPDVRRFNSMDWNVFHRGDMPEEWGLRDSQGNIVMNPYGPRPDMSNFCPPSPAYGNKRYNEWLVDHVFEYMSDERLEGYICQGVHQYPYGVSDVDLDRNGVNDFSEHGFDWIKEQWSAGLNSVTTTVFPWFQANNKTFVLNSGFFHLWEWDNTNGLMIEKNYVPTAFKWFYPKLQDWTYRAPQPHAFMWDARGQTKNSYVDFRFLLVYALLGDVYYSFTTWDAGEHRYIYYYDEYDIDLGYPLGVPVELSSECHVRYFDGGLVIINASGAPQTVTDAQLRSETSQYYDGPYYRFIGGQQPLWNDGTEFTSMDFAGSSHEYNTQTGDAIILVKEPKYVIADIIVDDCFSGTSPSTEDPVFLSSWTRGDQRGSEFWCMCNRPYQDLFAFMYTFPGSGESQAIYTPAIGVAGNYEVFEWHGYMGDTPEHIQEGTNVPYTINYAYGMATSGTIDQTTNYGQWNSLGTHYFEAGKTGNVIINNNADGMVIADAFKFVFRGVELDTEAPNAPSSLNASNLTENTISLAWTAPLPASDGDVASAYQVFRDGALVGTPAETDFVDRELTESTTYSYTVYAVDDGGNRSVDGISGTYTTSADETGPLLVSATATGVGTVEIKFNEDVEQASAESIHNYTIEPAITIFSVSLQSDYRTVELSTSAHVVGAPYSATVNNVRDRASNPNPIISGSNAGYVGYAGKLIIAITGDDSYELYVNGEQVGYGNTWYQSQRYEVSSVGGKNVIAVKCVDQVDKGGFLAEIDFNGKLYVTDDSWRATTDEIADWQSIDLNDMSWPKATECGLHGVALPWAQYNNVNGISIDNGAQWIWSSDQENDNTVYFRLVLNTGGDITPPAPPQGVTVSSQ